MWTTKFSLLERCWKCSEALFIIVCPGRLAAKIARKDSLALKLALRPDRQELIDRNILQIQSDKERQETKEAVGARLIRSVSNNMS